MQHNNPNLPPPSSNPLEMDEREHDQLRREHSQDTDAHLPEDDGHETLQRGMPGRNIKTWAVGTLGLVVAAALLWPSSDGNDANKAKAIAAQESIADELARRVPPKAPEIVIEAPPAPEPPKVVEKEKNDDERLAMILASPMAAEVELRTKRSAQPDMEQGRVDAQGLIRDVMSRADETMRRYGGDNAGAGDKSPARSKGAHQDFLDESRNSRQEPAMGLADARRPNTIYEGTLIRTVLTRELRTDLPGRITAKVMSDVYDSVTMNTLLIPRGSEVTCAYQSELLVGQEVVLAACNRLRLPNGKSFSLLGTPASDLQGAAGMPAEVNNHFWKMFGTSFMLGAASLLLSKADQTISLTMGTDGSTQASGNLLSSTLYDTIRQVMSRNSKIAPTATVEIGSPFTLTIARDVEMEPYQGR